MTDIYLFAPRQSVEVVRILDGELEGCEVEKFPIRLFDGVEHVYAYCMFRRVRKREDGIRFVPICLETEKDLGIGIQSRSVIEDEKCCPHV